MSAVAEPPTIPSADRPAPEAAVAAPPAGCVAESDLARFHEWATNYIALQVERGLPVSPVGSLWRQWNAPPLPAPAKTTLPEPDWAPLPPDRSWGDVLDDLGIAGPPVLGPDADEKREAAEAPMAGFGRNDGGEAGK